FWTGLSIHVLPSLKCTVFCGFSYFSDSSPPPGSSGEPYDFFAANCYSDSCLLWFDEMPPPTPTPTPPMVVSDQGSILLEK
ncbi:hypothetical protein LEMLEM_LOCUS22315, partial [Lemmus lemmus]